MIAKTTSGCREMKRIIIGVCLFLVILTIIVLMLSGQSGNKKTTQYRSTSLKEMVSQSGDVERIDYVDVKGTITVAAEKYYATRIKTTSGLSVLEEFFDADGKPAEQPSGYYAILREFNEKGQNYRVTYLGSNQEPIILTAGYSILLKIFDQEGLVQKELYLDTQGNLVKTDLYGCGCLRSHNEDGFSVALIYIDENDRPIITKSGYAIIHRTYYTEGQDTGRVESELYFDENEHPIALSLGQYGVRYEYDKYGRKAILTYLGIDGDPMINTDGYSTVKRTFYSDDTVETEMYYDIKGNPISLFNGRYGIKHINGRIIGLDKNSKEIFDINIWLHHNPVAVVVIGVLIVVLSLILNKKWNIPLLVLYVVFILYITLMCRTQVETKTELELLWSYKQLFSSSSLRLEILNNIWLFIPLGVIFSNLWPKAWIILASILLSVAIESFQYFIGIGLAEFDDVISNGVGCIIGYGVYRVIKQKT